MYVCIKKYVYVYFRCSVFTSLVDDVEFVCFNWQDPENIGIQSYLLVSTDLSTKAIFFKNYSWIIKRIYCLGFNTDAESVAV